MYLCPVKFYRNMYDSDPRTVITLDAGGTHFRFSAMRGCEAVTDTFELPTHPNDLSPEPRRL